MPATQTKIEVKNLGNRTGEVLIYDEIGGGFFNEGVTAKNFRNDLDDLGDVDTLNVYINSPGGSVFEGVAIYNILKKHSAFVNVYIEGAAWSMASGISQAGDKVYMTKNSLFMMHDPQGVAFGDAGEMRKTADRMDQVKKQLAHAYVEKSGKSDDEVNQLMADETWMDADEALEHGFIDEIEETESEKLESNFEVPDFINMPGRIFSAVNAFMAKPRNPKKEVPTMADENKGPKDDKKSDPDNFATIKPVPATVTELKNLDGADSDFVLEQLEKNATLADATAALNKILVDKLNKANSPESKDEVDHENRGNKPPVGVKPLNTDNPKDHEGADPHGHKNMSNEEKKAELSRLVGEKKLELGNRFDTQKVMNQIRVAHPDLFAA